MRGIDARLSSMERQVAANTLAVCPVCGRDPAAPVVFAVGEGCAARDTDVGAEYCPGCGAITWFTILFDNTRRDRALR